MTAKTIGKKKVKIAELNRNLFVRQELNHDHAIHLGELIEAGVKLPPITVTPELVIVDGRHRVTGYELAGVEEIWVEIVEYSSEIEMIAAAYQANTGGALPPTSKDTEHTVGLLVDRRETITHIAELLGLPASITRRFVSSVKSKRKRQKLLDAAAAVREGGLSVPKAAEEYGVDPEEMKRTLGGRVRGKRAQQVGEFKKTLTYNYKSTSSKTAAMMRQLSDQFEDGDIGLKELMQVFEHIESLQKKQQRTVADWRDRFLTKGRTTSAK